MAQVDHDRWPPTLIEAAFVLKQASLDSVHENTEKEEERRTGFFHKAYLIVLLGICSLASIFSLASGVYETLRFFLIPPIDAFSYRSPPGPILSTALVFVPPWAYCLRSVSRGLKGGEGEV